MSDEKRVIGQFLKRRFADPDDPNDMYAPGGSLVPEKSFHEVDIQKNLTPNLPGAPARRTVLPFQPPPALSMMEAPPLQPAPSITPTQPAGRQPSQSPGSMRSPPPPPKFTPEPIAPVPAPPAFSPDPIAPVPPPPAFVANPRAVLPPPPGFVPDPLAPVPAPPTVKNTPLRPPAPPPSSTDAPGDHIGAPPYVPGPDQGGPQFEGRHSDSPGILDGGMSTIARASELIKRTDGKLDQFLKNLGVDQYALFVKTPVHTPGDLAIDPILYARHIARLGSHLGATGLAIFGAQQLALFSMNPRGRIWNPALTVPPPILINHLPPALDLPNREVAGAPVKDIHLEMAQGKYSVDAIRPLPPFYERQDNIGAGSKGSGGVTNVATDIAKAVGILGPGKLVGADSQNSSIVDDPSKVAGPLVPAALKERNFNNPERPYSEAASFRHKDLVDKSLRLGSDAVKGDLKKIFRGSWSDGSVKLSGINAMETKPNPSRITVDPKSDPLARSFFGNGVIPVKFKGENKYGFSTFTEGRGPVIDDDDAYVPLSFTDLRPIGNVYRTVFFRSFITSLNESFSPEWNKANFYGRTDAVATYMSTGRQVSLTFDIVAFSPEDVMVIYQKLNWLASMVYPEYDKDLLYASGPVVRLRIGDVINARGPEGGFGLPGIIESLDFDYSEAIWELKKDQKVPRRVKVGLSFTILHDGPIGRGEEGRFGLIGQFWEGKYVPPGAGEQKAAGDDHLKFPHVEGISAFRRVGGDNADSDFNRYKDLASADKDM